jgi:hypothetical protein
MNDTEVVKSGREYWAIETTGPDGKQMINRDVCGGGIACPIDARDQSRVIARVSKRSDAKSIDHPSTEGKWEIWAGSGWKTCTEMTAECVDSKTGRIRVKNGETSYLSGDTEPAHDINGLFDVMDAGTSMYVQVPSIYQGENALHIAIVNENEELVKKLLEKAGDDLASLLGVELEEGVEQEEKHGKGRATGVFFVPDQGKGDETLACTKEHLYYGEYPLAFAVSTGLFVSVCESVSLLPACLCVCLCVVHRLCTEVWTATH